MKSVWVLLAFLFSFQAAQAQQYADFTPESGWYYDPTEPGRGLNIEVQNDIVGVSVYAYDDNGFPEWYLSAGQLSGNARYIGNLDRYRDGQCMGCSYASPSRQAAYAGVIDLQWVSPTAISVSWPGETFIAQRHWFAIEDQWDHMLGEWKSVMNFADAPDFDFPFLGDMLTFDYIDYVDNIDQFLGYRNETYESAAGFPDVDGNYLIIVRENSTTWLALYITDVGTNRMAGSAEFYPNGGTPTLNGYPFEMFRSASKSYVQNGTGPSKQAGESKTESNGLLKGVDSKQIEQMIAYTQNQTPRVLKNWPASRLTELVRKLEASILAQESK